MGGDIIPYAAGQLSNLLGGAASKAVAPAITNAAAKSGGVMMSNLLGNATKIPVTQVSTPAQQISVKEPEMVDLFRGMSAKTDDDLTSFVKDLANREVQPATHGGGNMQGEGYNFSTGKDVAEYYATRNPINESRTIVSTKVPKNRFITQNEQNQNRLVDFVRRAEGRGYSYEDGSSAAQGLKDMQKYFKKNGILGVKSNSGGTYVINSNSDDWLNNLKVLDAMKGRREGIAQDSELLSRLQNTVDQEINNKVSGWVDSGYLRARGDMEKVAESAGNTKIGKVYNAIAKYKEANKQNMVRDMIEYYDNDNFDWAGLQRRAEKIVKADYGDQVWSDLKSVVEPAVNDAPSEAAHQTNVSVLRNFLNSKYSDKIVKASRELVKPGTKIYRVGTPDGIFWSTKKSVGAGYDGAENTAILKASDRYIAPQFTGLVKKTLSDESEVIFLPRK